MRQIRFATVSDNKMYSSNFIIIIIIINLVAIWVQIKITIIIINYI